MISRLVSTQDLCTAIRRHALLEFEFGGVHRLVAPYCHGFTKRGSEVLRAVLEPLAARRGVAPDSAVSSCGRVLAGGGQPASLTGATSARSSAAG
jgi:hypothetical protein